MQKTDIAVIGAGAAGLMAAIHAARGCQASEAQVLLLDSRIKIGAKILISGGTRCNVTNRVVRPGDYHGGMSHFVRHVLEAYAPSETIRFFEEIGVELVLEPTGKYFPTTHSGRTVLNALLEALKKSGAKLEVGVRVMNLKKNDGQFNLETIGEDGKTSVITAQKVVLATGGLSYPETGSDGTGLKLAERLNHRLVKTAAALTPLMTDDQDWKALSGIAMEAQLSFYSKNRKRDETQGALLFTHFGFSGPAALDISRHWACADSKEDPRIEVSFLPGHTEESFKSFLESTRKENPNKQLKSFLHEDCGLVSRWVETFLKKIGLDATKKVGRLAPAEKSALIGRTLRYPLEVSGVYGYKKAEVTAGGVDLKQIRVSTMESRLVPGLYFAGEILDVDGRIGGFNFQWAWSSGTIAGRSAAKSLYSGVA